MKYYDWNQLKNLKLKGERGVCFEEVLEAIHENRVFDDEVHPNPLRYANQKVLKVLINGYVYLVPYVEDETKIFLKTIIPSRKATKRYLKGDSE